MPSKKREKSTQLDICEKILMIESTAGRLNVLHLTKKIYLFIYSAAMTLLFAVRRFPVAFLLLLSRTFEASAAHRDENINLFLMFRSFPH